MVVALRKSDKAPGDAVEDRSKTSLQASTHKGQREESSYETWKLPIGPPIDVQES